MANEYYGYTPQGLNDLAECVGYWLEQPKPHWNPRTSISAEELEDERQGRWSLDTTKTILMRELAPSRPITRDAIYRIQNPGKKTRYPNPEVILMLAELRILKPTRDGTPYDFIDLHNIARELLDWRTGELTKTAASRSPREAAISELQRSFQAYLSENRFSLNDASRELCLALESVHAIANGTRLANKREVKMLAETLKNLQGGVYTEGDLLRLIELASTQ